MRIVKKLVTVALLLSTVQAAQPVGTYDDGDDSTGGNLLVEHSDEVETVHGGIDIHKDLVARKRPREAIVDPPSGAGAIVAAVADKNFFGHHASTSSALR